MNVSKVLPTFKKEKKDDMSNWCHISILRQVFKILEKLFAKKLNSFIAIYEIISNSQYGFKANTSTSKVLTLNCQFIFLKGGY